MRKWKERKRHDKLKTSLLAGVKLPAMPLKLNKSLLRDAERLGVAFAD
jgi:hypothetical protein